MAVPSATVAYCAFPFASVYASFKKNLSVVLPSKYSTLTLKLYSFPGTNAFGFKDFPAPFQDAVRFCTKSASLPT